MEDLRTDIPVHFNFLFSDSHVEVISGKQEGTNEFMKPFVLKICINDKCNGKDIFVVTSSGLLFFFPHIYITILFKAPMTCINVSTEMYRLKYNKITDGG